MKIAFDIHGTIAANPEVFKPLMKAYMDAAIVVAIISGPPLDQIKDELFALGYQGARHYHPRHIYSVVDFIKERKVEMTQDENGNWWCPDAIWWDSKGHMCNIFEIDMIIDNDYRYASNMPKRTKFVHWRGEY